MDNTKNNEQDRTPATQADPTSELARRTAAIEISSSSNQATTVSNQAPQLQNDATAAPIIPQTTAQVPVGLLGNPTALQTVQNRQNRAVTAVNKTPLVGTQNLSSNNGAASNSSLLGTNRTNYSAPISHPQYPPHNMAIQAQLPVQPPYPSNTVGSGYYPSIQFSPSQYFHSYNPPVALYPPVNNANVPNGGFAPVQFPQNSSNVYPHTGYFPSPFPPYYPLPTTLPLMTYAPVEPDQVLIYAFYIPLELKINGETFLAVKVGAMDPKKHGFGTRFANLKVPWKGQLRLPTAKEVKKFYESSENCDDWEVSLAHLNFNFNHVIFLLTGLADNEHTIRAGLLSRFGGFSLPSRVISSLLAAVQNQPFPNIANTGHTEFIALRMADITEIRNAFVAGNLSIVSHPVQLLVLGQAIMVRDTAVLDFNDEDEEDEVN